MFLIICELKPIKISYQKAYNSYIITVANENGMLRNLTKFRPLFTLSHRGSNNSPLMIVFSANQTEISGIWKYFGSFDILTLKIWEDYIPEITRKRKLNEWKYCNAFKLRYLIGQNRNAKSKVLNTISNGELSNPLCDSGKRSLTIARLVFWGTSNEVPEGKNLQKKWKDQRSW